MLSRKRDLKISLAEAPQSCCPLNSCRKINEGNVHQRNENHMILLPYRLSTFKEQALQLSLIILASHADVLRSSSRVPVPPTSAERSDYKRILNICFHALTARGHPAAKGLAERHV